jgi:hypothetical protein
MVQSVFARGRRESFGLPSLGACVFTDAGSMFGAFVSRIGFRLRQVVRFGAVRFVRFLFGLFLGDFHIFRSVDLLRVFRGFVFVVVRGFLFGVIFFKFRASDESIGFSFRLSFLVFCFDEAGGKRDHFFFAQRSVSAGRLWHTGTDSRRLLDRGGCIDESLC